MKIDKATQVYLKNLTDIGRSPATIVAYKKDIEQLAEFTGSKDIGKITSTDIANFIASLQDQNLTNKTISRKLNSIKSLFKHFIEIKTIDDNPSKEIPHPEIKAKLPSILSEAEFLGLLETAKNNKKIFTLIQILLQTGMRIGEISRLKLDDVQLDVKPEQILIRKHASSPMRVVDLNTKAYEAIKEYLKTRPKPEGDQNYLFTTKNGGPIIIRNIRSSVNRVFSRAGLNHVTVNDLRNTFIVKQLEGGVSLAKVASTVGHRRFSSTEKYLPLLERKELGNGEKLIEL